MGMSLVVNFVKQSRFGEGGYSGDGVVPVETLVVELEGSEGRRISGSEFANGRMGMRSATRNNHLRHRSRLRVSADLLTIATRFAMARD